MVFKTKERLDKLEKEIISLNREVASLKLYVRTYKKYTLTTLKSIDEMIDLTIREIEKL